MTEKLYFTDDALEADVLVLSSVPGEEPGQWLTVADRTLFHAKGGGQPGDVGTLGAARVLSTYADGNTVVHVTDTCVPAGAAHEKVDADKRLLNTRLHSAGHLIAEAGAPFGWHAYKGNHIPGECRVVFRAERSEAQAPSAEQIQAGLNALVAADLPRRIVVEGGVRTVTWGDLPASPCGGTHVASTAQVGAVTVTKSKVKKGELSVSYSA